MARTRFTTWLVVLSAVALSIAVVVLVGFDHSARPRSNAEPVLPRVRPAPASHSAALPADSPRAASNTSAPGRTVVTSPQPALLEAQAALDARIEALKQALATQTDPGQRRALLAAFKRAILAAPEAAAAASLSEFLASGRDVDTGLPFIVGADGMMDSVPSLRSAALDLLPATDLPRAAEIARAVLHQRRSAAEYVLGLRNLAWNDFDGDQRDELAMRFNDLVNLHAWRHDPDNAYLEGLDIAVVLADRTAFRTLSSMVDDTATSQAATALSHAALIALDRLVIRDPGLLVAAYREDPGFLSAATDQRASLLSRLDLGAAEQRAVLVDYLSRPDHGAGELTYFADLYPNANVIHGDWLVTTEESSPSMDERRELDRATVEAIDTLLATGPEDSVRTVLTRVRDRLQAFEIDASNTAVPLLGGPPSLYAPPRPSPAPSLR